MADQLRNSGINYIVTGDFSVQDLAGLLPKLGYRLATTEIRDGVGVTEGDSIDLKLGEGESRYRLNDSPHALIVSPIVSSYVTDAVARERIRREDSGFLPDRELKSAVYIADLVGRHHDFSHRDTVGNGLVDALHSAGFKAVYNNAFR